MNSQEYLSDDSSITDDQHDSAVGLVSPEDPAIILRTTVGKDRFSSPPSTNTVAVCNRLMQCYRW